MGVLLKCESCNQRIEVEGEAQAQAHVCPICHVVLQPDTGEPETDAPEGEAAGPAEEHAFVEIPLSLAEALYVDAEENQEGVPCRGCGKRIPGTPVQKEVYVQCVELSQFPVVGYQCGDCACYYCNECKQLVLDFNPLHGFKYSKCPNCMNSFRPRNMLLAGDPAEIARMEAPVREALGLAANGPAAEVTDPAGAAAGASPAAVSLKMSAHKLQLGLGIISVLGGIATLLGANTLGGPGSLQVSLLGMALGLGGLYLCSQSRKQDGSAHGPLGDV